MAGIISLRYLAIQIGLVLSVAILWAFVRTHDQQSPLPELTPSTCATAQPCLATKALANSKLLVEVPKAIVEGVYNLPTLRAWNEKNFQCVLERTDERTSLWGRLDHMHNMYILYVEDVTKFEQRGPKFIELKFIWRARKLKTGAVYVADQKFSGTINFPTSTEGPRRDQELEISLHNSNLGQESLLFGIRSGVHEEEYAKTLLVDVKKEWESMENSFRKVGRKIINAMGFHGYH